jgi:hypothetical protein
MAARLSVLHAGRKLPLRNINNDDDDNNNNNNNNNNKAIPVTG